MTDVRPPDAEVLDMDFLQDPHAVYARLRQEGPAHRVVLPHGWATWIVTRYDEARAVLADPRLSKNGRLLGEYMDPDLLGEDDDVFASALRAHMLNSDPPDHTRLRKLVNKAFTARRVEALRSRIEEITDHLLDAMAASRSAEVAAVDLLEAYAFPLPVTVICELLGVPSGDRDRFRAWSTVLVADAPEAQVQEASHAMAGYLARLIAAKRADPGDDLLTGLVQAGDGDAAPLDETELVSMAFLLLVAGHETTVNLIGNGVLALLRNPDQLAALRADPGLLPGAIEEFLRYEGPVNLATMRYTTEPVRVGDVDIPGGEFVLVSLGSANRDEHRFADPDRLEVTRPPAGHLAFGHGIHFCLGAPLARLEGEIAVGRLLSRFPDLRLAAEPTGLRWRSSSLIRGLESLPVRLA